MANQIVEQLALGGVLKDKKRMSFEVQPELYDHIQEQIKTSGKTQSDWFREQYLRGIKEIETMDKTITPEQACYNNLVKQASQGQPDRKESPMASIMDIMKQMMEAEMAMKMMDRFGGGNNSTGSSSEEELRRERKEDEIREYRRLEREAQNQAAMQQMVILTSAIGGGGKGSGDMDKILQQMKETQMASDRRFEESERNRTEAEREKRTQDQFATLSEDRKYYQDALMAEKEQNAERLVQVRDELDAKMHAQLQAVSLGKADKNQDEFGKTLETWGRVNSMVEDMAPHLGFRKSGPLAIDQLRQVAGPGVQKSFAQSLIEGFGAATGLLAEARALVNDGLAAVDGAKGIVPQQAAQRPTGMPSVPRGPPMQQQARPAHQLQQVPPKVIPKTPPQAPPIGDIDQDILEMSQAGELKTNKGIPLTRNAMIALTKNRRDNLGVGEIQICEDHGELEPCPQCAPVRVPVPQPQPQAAPQQTPPPVPQAAPPAVPTPCPACGSPEFTAETGCPLCLNNLLAQVQKYQPLVQTLSQGGYDVAPIIQKVDELREDAEKFDYKAAARKTEAAAQMIVAGFEAMQVSAGEAPPQEQPPAQAPTEQELIAQDNRLLDIGNELQDAALANLHIDFNEDITLYNKGANDWAAGAYKTGLEEAEKAHNSAMLRVRNDTTTRCACGAALTEGGTICVGCATGATPKEPAAAAPPAHIPATHSTVQEAVASPPEPVPEPDREINPDFHPIVEVPEGLGDIVGIKNGPFGRVVGQNGTLLEVMTVAGPIEVPEDQLKSGVCKYCGRDCKTAGGRGTHEKSCERTFYAEA